MLEIFLVIQLSWLHLGLIHIFLFTLIGKSCFNLTRKLCQVNLRIPEDFDQFSKCASFLLTICFEEPFRWVFSSFPSFASSTEVKFPRDYFPVEIPWKRRGKKKIDVFSISSSVGRQSELNPELWLATRTGKKVLPCQLGITRWACYEREDRNGSLIISPSLTKLVRSIWLDSFFLER